MSRSLIATVLSTMVGCVAVGSATVSCGQPSTNGPPSPGISRSAARSASVGLGAPAVSAAPATVTASSVPPPPAPAPLVILEDSGPIETIDLHVDTPWKVHFKDRPLSLPEGHATPDKLRAGHYAGIVYPIYIPDYIHKWKPSIADADAILETVEKLIAEHDLLCPATGGSCPADKVTAFISIEGAGGFAADISQIDRFIKRGVRMVGPVHAHDNKLASSATGKKDIGLTALGKEFCARVYAAGALVDVSHMSDRSFADLLPIAEKAGAPVIATHSNARVKRNHKRNLSDDQLRKIAATGGVAGLNLHRTFVRQTGAGMKHVVALVKHMVEVAGVDHVAIGSDYDGGKPVSALSDASKMPKLAEALQEAGMSEADVRKIFAKNALRVLSWQPPKDG